MFSRQFKNEKFSSFLEKQNTNNHQSENEVHLAQLEQRRIIEQQQIQQKKQAIKVQSDNQFLKEEQNLKQLLDQVYSLKQNIMNDDLENIIQMIIDSIENLKQTQQRFQEKLITSFEFLNLYRLECQLQNQENNLQLFKVQIIKQLYGFQKKYMNFDYFDQNSVQYNKINEGQGQLENFLDEEQLKIGKFSYDSDGGSELQESKFCHTFAFNKDNSILIVGCKSKIKIYKFINGKIGNQIQVLSHHNHFVQCLYFMKQSGGFVSGSYDHSIIIWQCWNKNEWLPFFILKEHKDSVECLMMNQEENLLITGSNDKTIKFFKKQNDQWSYQQTIITNYFVDALSLNDMGDKLISCGTENTFHVMGIQADKSWSIIQEINANSTGYRLCFTIGEQFIFQPKNKDYLEIYDYNEKSKQFEKVSQVQIQSGNYCCILFPCQYIKSLNILFVKNGHFLNIFWWNNEKNYELVQSIDYNSWCLYGTVSQDGQYLITWDKGLEKIQVRRLKLLN